MIAILDHGAGNIRSLVNSLRRLGADALVSDDINELRGATKLILPGVGEAWAAMESLNKNNLTDWLREVQVPVLGICLGMQLLFERSDERKT
ncbi:MAG: imidazole glycerol phosphate synthase subunit HisH, partial [Deltaproteobacteria bacterium]|nr:imidazole glycerol phosphate synthase subunit HisH [Deltaproteobacteria bacterium]